MGLTADDKKWILANLHAAGIGDGRTLGGSVNALVTEDKQADGSPTSTVGRLTLDQGIPNGDATPPAAKWTAAQVITDTRRLAIELQAAVTALSAAVATLNSGQTVAQQDLDELKTMVSQLGASS